MDHTTWTTAEVWVVAVLVAMGAGSAGVFLGALLAMAARSDEAAERKRQRAWREYE